MRVSRFASIDCTEAALTELLRAARTAAPHEIAAVLGGEVTDGHAHVRRVLRLPNAAIDQDDSFVVDAIAFAQCEHQLRATSNTFLGFAHSHPNGNTSPSLRDREQLWTDCAQVITNGHTWQAFVLDAARVVHALATTSQEQHS